MAKALQMHRVSLVRCMKRSEDYHLSRLSMGNDIYFIIYKLLYYIVFGMGESKAKAISLE